MTLPIQGHLEKVEKKLVHVPGYVRADGVHVSGYDYDDGVTASGEAESPKPKGTGRIARFMEARRERQNQAVADRAGAATRPKRKSPPKLMSPHDPRLDHMSGAKLLGKPRRALPKSTGNSQTNADRGPTNRATPALPAADNVGSLEPGQAVKVGAHTVTRVKNPSDGYNYTITGPGFKGTAFSSPKLVRSALAIQAGKESKAKASAARPGETLGRLGRRKMSSDEIHSVDVDEYS